MVASWIGEWLGFTPEWTANFNLRSAERKAADEHETRTSIT
jgi:hypothetical protein